MAVSWLYLKWLGNEFATHRCSDGLEGLCYSAQVVGTLGKPSHSMATIAPSGRAGIEPEFGIRPGVKQHCGWLATWHAVNNIHHMKITSRRREAMGKPWRIHPYSSALWPEIACVCCVYLSPFGGVLSGFCHCIFDKKRWGVMKFTC